MVGFSQIEQIIALVKKHGLGELAVEFSEVKGKEDVIRSVKVATSATRVEGASLSSDLALVKTDSLQSVGQSSSAHQVLSPIVGTVYLTPTPESAPYVQLGQSVAAGDVVCLLEAMKIYNKIKVGKPGKIVSCHVTNGDSVEFNQPLFTLEYD